MVIYCVFGTPSILSQWLLHFMAQFAEVLHGAPQIIPCVHLEAMRQSWGERAGRSAVIYSDIPEEKLSRIFLSAGAPMVVAHDDPMQALNFAMSSRKLELRQGLRFLTQSYATLEEIFLAPGALIVGPRRMQMRLRDFVAHVAGAVGGAISEAQMGAVVARMVGPHMEDSLETVGENIHRHLPPATLGSGLTRADEALAHATLDQYAVMASGQPMTSMECPIDLLHDWDRLGSYLSSDAPIELTGPARLLTAGHVFHLPVGLWRARVEIEVTNNLSGNGLSTDILSGDVSLSGVSARLPASGNYAFEIDFVVADGFPPLQLRMALQEGAIEGELRLARLSFVRQRLDEGLAA